MSCFSLRKSLPLTGVDAVVLTRGRDNKEGVQSFMQKRPAKFTGTMDNTQVSAYPWWVPVDVGNRAKAVGSTKPKI